MIKNIQRSLIISSLAMSISLHALENKLATLSRDLGLLQMSSAQQTSQKEWSTPFLATTDFPSDVRLITADFNALAPLKQTLQELETKHSISLIQPTVAWQNLSLGAAIGKGESTARDMAHISGYTSEKDYATLLALCVKNNQESVGLYKIALNVSRLAKPDISVGGGGESCGYHAMAHLQTVCNALTAPDRTKELTMLMNLERVNKLFASPAFIQMQGGKPIWRTWIQTHNNDDLLADYNGEWLTNDGIKALYKKYVEKKALKKLPNMSWDIIECTKEGILVEANIATVKNAIRDYPVATFTLFEASSLHWIDIIVIRSRHATTKKGFVQVIILDSKNKPRYNHPTVIELVTFACEIELSENLKTLPNLHKLLGPVRPVSQDTLAKIYRKELIAGLAQRKNIQTLQDSFSSQDQPFSKLTLDEKMLFEALSGIPIINREELMQQTIKKLKEDPAFSFRSAFLVVLTQEEDNRIWAATGYFT